PTFACRATAMARSATFAYPCAMSTATSSWSARTISGQELPRKLTSESWRPRNEAPGVRAMYGIPRRRSMLAATSEPHSGVRGSVGTAASIGSHDDASDPLRAQADEERRADRSAARGLAHRRSGHVRSPVALGSLGHASAGSDAALPRRVDDARRDGRG